MDGLKIFEEKIGYSFQDLSLLQDALTHSSFANERGWAYERNNERLEFLGDAVLELVSSDFIFHEHGSDTEGKMTKLRASLVCEQSLAGSARELGLGDHIRLGKGERATGGAERDSILSDAFEAVIGAVYLDGGLENAAAFIRRFVLSDIEDKKLFYDSKTILQEMIQDGGKHTLSYELISESGPDHAKEFVIRCNLNGKPMGTGTGKSKKAAEQKAAYETILKIRKNLNGKPIGTGTGKSK